jgi:hypothetical protein
MLNQVGLSGVLASIMIGRLGVAGANNTVPVPALMMLFGPKLMASAFSAIVPLGVAVTDAFTSNVTVFQRLPMPKH